MNSQKTVAAGWVCGHLSWRPAKDKVVHWEQSGFWALTKSQKYTNKTRKLRSCFQEPNTNTNCNPTRSPPGRASLVSGFRRDASRCMMKGSGCSGWWQPGPGAPRRRTQPAWEDPTAQRLQNGLNELQKMHQTNSKTHYD